MDAPNGTPSNSGGSESGEPGSSSGGGPGSAPETDPVSADDIREASSLVYERLKDELQRGELDQNLLNELGYTEADAKRFAEQLEKRLNAGDAQSPAEQARKRQFEAILEQMGRDASAAERRASDGPRQDAGGFAAPRREAPMDYRQLERIYKERLLKQK